MMSVGSCSRVCALDLWKHVERDQVRAATPTITSAPMMALATEHVARCRLLTFNKPQQ